MNQPQELPQLVLLERLVSTLKSLQQVRAAFLRGSFYHGHPDIYSDLDVFVVAEEASTDHLIELGRAALKATGVTRWISLLDAASPRLRALFPGPVRVNLSVVTAESLPPYEGWRILFDHDQLLSTRARPGRAFEPLGPEHVAMVCDEFWWSVFSSVSQLKRGQLWTALHLLDICRANLAQMMRWRRDFDHPSERYRDLERHLTAEDQQALAQTLSGYDLRGIAEALLCATDAFDPAARDVAARTAATYPATLAQATKEFFIHEFWSLIAPGTTISA